MRLPIRINQSFLPRICQRMMRRVSFVDYRTLLDPKLDSRRRSEIASTIRIGHISKTTQPARYPKSARMLLQLPFPTPPVILEVGASSGVATQRLREAMHFSRYYVTDRWLSIVATSHGSRVFFRSRDGDALFYVNDFIVVLAECNGAPWPLRTLARRILKRRPATGESTETVVSLVSQGVEGNEGRDVRVMEYDVLTPWPEEKVDLVIAANLLNRSYFSDAQIRTGIGHLKRAMREGGILAVVENRQREQATLFRLRTDKLVTEAQVGVGSDIQALVESVQ